METKIINLDELTPIRNEKPDWSEDGSARPVFRIRLQDLYYNSDNGRIATWISGYESEPNHKPLEEMSREEFNKLIEGFIIKSEKDATLKKTKDNIEKIGQIRPGVILSDGRILSGNRRFTCLRLLYQKSYAEKFAYFECFILPVPKNADDKQYIKTIERTTQFGVNEKQDYNSIEKLVDIYKILVDPKSKLWSEAEYSKKFNAKPGDVKTMVTCAKIMVEYLEYIKKPLCFYVAREQKLDGPLHELANLYKKVEEKEWNRIKEFLYASLYSTITNKKARTVSVRSLLKAYSDNRPKFEAALSSFYGDADKADDEFINSLRSGGESKTENHDSTKKSTVPLPMSRETEKLIDVAIVDTQKKLAANKPIKQVDEAIKSLEKVDLEMVPKMDESGKRQLRQLIERLQKKIFKIGNKLG